MDGCLCFVDDLFYNAKYLIFLLKDYVVIRFVVIDIYERFGYGFGVDYILIELRVCFWIIKGRRLV